MEISATEIKILCNRINSLIEGYSVSSVYSIEGGILLRLRHETKPEQLIAISSFAAWNTKKNLALPEAESFIGRIRDYIERTKLVEVRQEQNERVATFKFSSKKSGELRYLHAEFFAGGNQILTDEKEVILDARKSERFRHRSIAKGEIFAMPPPRGIALEDVSFATLTSQLEKPEGRTSNKFEQRDISAIRWFGRAVGTSRKFVQEIFHRSGVPEETPMSDLTAKQITALATESQALRREIETSTKGYLLIPTESSVPDSNQSSLTTVDVCPIIPNAWKVLQELDLADIEEYDSYSEALDEAQVQAYVVQTRLEASKEVRRRLGELDSAVQKQQAKVKENTAKSEELRTIAKSLMDSVDSQIGLEVDIMARLENMGVVERDPFRPAILNFASEPTVRLDSYASHSAIASRLFDEAKKLEESNIPLLRTIKELLAREDKLRTQASSTEERAEKRREFEKRARQWFERYRWFFTSDSRLAVGGRDATSNSVIINKYSSAGDIIFHADIHGSPFFVLKDGAEVLVQGQTKMDSEVELAQATASFSRAWKDELGSADAYWVSVDQVKKSPPSGEYLPRGSFFIEGKKNFVRHVRIELCVGVTSDKLFGKMNLKDNILNRDQTANSEDSSHPIIVCGPEKSLSSYCYAMAKIAPGKERSSSIARRLKQLLISKVKENDELKEKIKRIPIDDIIRVLPSGSHKIVSEKQNR
jgi:predicted ribosome quality control (RQC) complex YloA/Tae2 family protein